MKLRKYKGGPGYEFRISFVIFRTDIAFALAYQYATLGRTFPTSRQHAIDITRDYLVTYGELCVDLPSPEEGEGDPMELALAIVDRLFPELNEDRNPKPEVV